jgi:hypothetical protein
MFLKLKKIFIMNTTLFIELLDIEIVLHFYFQQKLIGKKLNSIVITSLLILHTCSSNNPLWRGGANVDFLLRIRGLATIFLTGALMDCRRFFCLDIVGDFDFYRFVFDAAGAVGKFGLGLKLKQYLQI